MFDRSWLASSSHGTHAVVFLLAFQGETQNTENKRVRGSMKYSLPIGSVVFANCWGAVFLMQPHSSGVDHPCIARSLEFVWETMPCNGAMRCDVCMAHGCSGDTVGADRCIRVHVYIVVAFYGAFRALRAHRAGIGFYTHTYAILLTRT